MWLLPPAILFLHPLRNDPLLYHLPLVLFQSLTHPHSLLFPLSHSSLLPLALLLLGFPPQVSENVKCDEDFPCRTHTHMHFSRHTDWPQLSASVPREPEDERGACSGGAAAPACAAFGEGQLQYRRICTVFKSSLKENWRSPKVFCPSFSVFRLSEMFQDYSPVITHCTHSVWMPLTSPSGCSSSTSPLLWGLAAASGPFLHMSAIHTSTDPLWLLFFSVVCRKNSRVNRDNSWFDCYILSRNGEFQRNSAPPWRFSQEWLSCQCCSEPVAWIHNVWDTHTPLRPCCSHSNYWKAAPCTAYGRTFSFSLSLSHWVQADVFTDYAPKGENNASSNATFYMIGDQSGRNVPSTFCLVQS